MPDLSNVLICDMPLRFDTYKGCSHGCAYCFARGKTDISKVEKKESPTILLDFINKRRKGETVYKIFDYDIPLHWGGLSDPMQPIEKELKISLDCLKVFKETQYPFLISTKSTLLATDEYLDILKDCNCAVQYSAIGTCYDKFEKGSNTFLERIEAMRKISKHKRVIVRAQPLIPKVEREFTANLKLFKDVGVYGIIIEFMKYKYKAKGTKKIRGDNVFPITLIKPIFDRIKIKANNLGLKVFAGENRLRQYGDGLCCCGVGDMWKTHKANFNHLLFEDKEIEISKCFNDKLKGDGSQPNWWGLGQGTKAYRWMESICYNELLNMAMKSKEKLQDYTIDKQAYKNIKNFKAFGE